MPDSSSSFSFPHRVSGARFPLSPSCVYWAPDDWTDWNYTITRNVIFNGMSKAVGCNQFTSPLRTGIYPDDGSVGGLISENTFFNPKVNYPVSDDYSAITQWAVAINGGRTWNLTNNVIVDTAFTYIPFSANNFYDTMHAVKWDAPPYSTHYPRLAALKGTAERGQACLKDKACPSAPWDNSLTLNIGMNNTPSKDIEGLPIVLCAESGKDGGNGDSSCRGFPDSNTETKGNMLGEQDPGFASAKFRERADFRIKQDSPAVKAGFVPIDYTTIGPGGCCAHGCVDC